MRTILFFLMNSLKILTFINKIILYDILTGLLLFFYGMNVNSMQ